MAAKKKPVKKTTKKASPLERIAKSLERLVAQHDEFLEFHARGLALGEQHKEIHLRAGAWNRASIRVNGAVHGLQLADKLTSEGYEVVFTQLSEKVLQKDALPGVSEQGEKVVPPETVP